MELRTRRLERVRHRRTAGDTAPEPRGALLTPASITPGRVQPGRLVPRARLDQAA